MKAVATLVNAPNSYFEEGKIKRGAPPAQLYDLETDRNQTTNLYSRLPEVVSAMKATLENYRPATQSAPERNPNRKKQ